ncbi:MAG: DUF5615 family PIN-like protein [Bacteroidota bacterium]
MRLLLADENFPFPVVEFLREYGWDVLTILEADLAGQAFPDEGVMAFAIQEERTILTLNRKDFVRLHRIITSHFGIVVCKFDVDFKRLSENVIQVIEEERDLKNKLVRVSRKG